MCTIAVIFLASSLRTKPDGVIPFCRSMGAPEADDLMFSYKWGVHADNVRTLARATSEAGVSVWIDTVKLSSGDEVRPLLRSIVRSVFRCVVFLTEEYTQSPNCCIEFLEAIHYPRKLIVCVLESTNKWPKDSTVWVYLKQLQLRGAKVFSGFDECVIGQMVVVVWV